MVLLGQENSFAIMFVYEHEKYLNPFAAIYPYQFRELKYQFDKKRMSFFTIDIPEYKKKILYPVQIYITNNIFELYTASADLIKWNDNIPESKVKLIQHIFLIKKLLTAISRLIFALELIVILF